MPEDPRDTTENRQLVRAIMQAVVDSEPDTDPDAEDAIVISVDALDTIISNQICGDWHKPWSQFSEQERREARGFALQTLYSGGES